MDDVVFTLAKLGVMLLLVFANGFFVAAEFALVSIRKTRVEEMVDRGIGSAKYVLHAVQDLDRYIAGTQVGITIASLALGWIGEPALAHLIEPLFSFLPGFLPSAASHSVAVALAFAIITFLHVVLGELVPKSLALQKTDRTALIVARPMTFVIFLFQPLIWALNGLGNLLLKFIGLEPTKEHHAVHSVDELAILVRQSHEAGVLDDREKQMVQGAFRLGALMASEVMIPRPDIIAIDINLPIKANLEKISQTIHSRLPVYEKNLDNIIGIVLINDLFRHTIKSDDDIVDLRQCMHPALAVPDTIPLDELLQRFRERRTQIAIVVNEFGSTVGLLTLEDLIEEVFGELQDILEAGQPSIQRLPDGRILVRGEIRLPDLNEELGWDLEDEDADTIAGFVINRLGRLARIGDSIDTPYGAIRVINMARMRITQLAIFPLQTANQPTPPVDAHS